jgi:uncharacterized protein YcnI
VPRSGIVWLAALFGLIAAGNIAAHVIATPAFLSSDSAASIALSVPNERDDPMTGFSVTAPEGLEIQHAHEIVGWTEQIGGLTASWTGGSLAPDDEVSFGMTLRADADPGVLQLQAEQSYDDGAVVRWPVSITVTPAAESSSQSLPLAAVVGLIGALTVVAIGVLARRRRTTGALQEK